MNLPNILTALRFLIIPVFAFFLSSGGSEKRGYYVIALILFVLAGITDILDGYLARKYNQITAWGKIADPLADKLLQVTALVILTIKGIIPSIILIVIILKELMMAIGGYLIYNKKNHIVTANWYGKVATAIFYLSISLVIIDTNRIRNYFYVALAIASSLFAFILYTIKYLRIQKNLIKIKSLDSSNPCNPSVSEALDDLSNLQNHNNTDNNPVI